MKKNGILKAIIIIAIVAVVAVITSAGYVVHQNEYVTVRRFGKIIAIAQEPGLHFKTPFVDDTQSISAKIVLYDIPASDVITKDKKSMITDTYVLWKVSEPLKYVQTLNAISDMIRAPPSRLGKLSKRMILVADSFSHPKSNGLSRIFAGGT